MRARSNGLGRRAGGPAAALAAWVLAGCVTGCGGDSGSAGVIGDSAYVEVMSQLASLRWRFSARDSLAADSARIATLRERGLVLEDLERFAVRHGSDPESMAALWEVIAARADELASGLDPENDLQLELPDSTGVRPR